MTRIASPVSPVTTASPVRFSHAHPKDLDRLPYTEDVTAFLDENRFRWTDSTYSSYDVTLRRLTADLRGAGFTADPRTIGRREVNHLMSLWDGRLAPSTQRNMLRVLSSYCGHYGNHAVRSMHVLYSSDDASTRDVDWLTGEQLSTLLRSVTEPMLVCATMFLSYGMLRRVDAVRIRMQDVDLAHDRVTIRGKGHRGGKRRVLPLTPPLRTALVRWIDKRGRMVRAYQDRFDDGHTRPVGPEALFIWRDEAGRVGPMKEGSWDNNVKRPLQRIAEENGFRLGGNHTLRRTGARLLYRAGCPLVELQLALGHESPQMTERYMGLTADDLLDTLTLAHGRLSEMFGDPLTHRTRAPVSPSPSDTSTSDAESDTPPSTSESDDPPSDPPSDPPTGASAVPSEQPCQCYDRSVGTILNITAQE